MKPVKVFVALVAGLVLVILVLATLRNQWVGAVQTFAPGPLARDPVVAQARLTGRPSSDVPIDSGWVYIDGRLDKLESVKVAGASLQMVIVVPESSFFRGGRPDRHIVRVSIAREQEYIDGFTVELNGRTYRLTRAPSTWLGSLLGANPRGAEPVGRRIWSNRWFPMADLAPVDPADAMPSISAGTVPLREGEQYVVRKRPFPHAMGDREVVSWLATEPRFVLATSMDRTEPARPDTSSNTSIPPRR